MSAEAVDAKKPAPSARREWALVLGAALAAAALSTFFFAPRFMVLRAFGVPALAWNIEIFRSPYFLAQVADPFAKIENLSNIVIQWRLLFPLLAHYLHLPVAVLWALPWAGCLLALVTAARMLWNHTRDVKLVWLGTMLTATCSWYFVATGWVFYFDGWLMSALLLAAFGRARWQMLTAALLTPWIDERFLLALPLCLGVRLAIFSRDENYRWRDWVRDGGWLLLGVAPYVGIRLWAWHADVWQAHGYADNKIGFNSSLAMSLQGAWQGLRAAWVPVVLLPVWLWCRQKRALALAGLAVIGATVVVNVGLAGDLSRSASVAVPAMLAGVMVWRDWRSRWAGCALIGLTVANFLLPAAHMVTVSRIPILYLHAELANWRQPPDQRFDPKAYNAFGVQATQAQKIQEAYAAFTTAIGLDPGYADALNNRGVLLYNSQHKPEGLADFTRATESEPQAFNGWLNRGLARRDMGDTAGATADLKMAVEAASRAVERDPKSPDAWLNRGQVRRQVGDLAGAETDLEKTIELAPADWPNLAAARQLLVELKAARKPGN